MCRDIVPFSLALLLGLGLSLLPLTGCTQKEPPIKEAEKQPAAEKEKAAGQTAGLTVIPPKAFEQTIQKQGKIVVMDVWALW